jgi:hypothetical protein
MEKQLQEQEVPLLDEEHQQQEEQQHQDFDDVELEQLDVAQQGRRERFQTRNIALVGASVFFVWLWMVSKVTHRCVPPSSSRTGPSYPMLDTLTAPQYSPCLIDSKYTYEDLKLTVLAVPEADRLRKWSKEYTSGPHLAGKGQELAEYTKQVWKGFGVRSEIVPYDVYINYPLGHRLALLKRTTNEKKGGNNTYSYNVTYEASLEEDVLPEDPTSGLKDRVPTFHGYSANGNVTAPYVYVNFGTFQDFEDLRTRNVSLKGKIALVKYGGIFRGLKVKRAQELGMVGVVMYSDPQEDGDIVETNGYKAYPDGPARNPSSVQRGSVQFLCKHKTVPNDECVN